MDPREALVALNMLNGIGPIRLRQLLEVFGDAPSILRARKDQLLHVHGIGDDTAESIVGWEKQIDLAGEMKKISDFGCSIVVQEDPEYPELLKQIYDPPIVICVPFL